MQPPPGGGRTRAGAPGGHGGQRARGAGAGRGRQAQRAGQGIAHGGDVLVAAARLARQLRQVAAAAGGGQGENGAHQQLQLLLQGGVGLQVAPRLGAEARQRRLQTRLHARRAGQAWQS